MKAWMSVVMSICLLVNSVAPAWADGVRGLGRGVNAAAKPVTTSLTRASVQAHVTDALLKQQAYENVFRLTRFTDVAGKEVLTRDAFTPLLSGKSLEPSSVNTALSVYRQDLASHMGELKQISSEESLSSFLQNTDKQRLSGYLETLSSASALATLGTKSDASLLIRFYHEAASGPLQEVAASITARGLLRHHAYEEFNSWAKTVDVNKSATLWQGLAQYLTERNLQVPFAVPSLSRVTPQAPVVNWLSQAGLYCSLHGTPSYENTLLFIDPMASVRLSPDVSAKAGSSHAGPSFKGEFNPMSVQDLRLVAPGRFTTSALPAGPEPLAEQPAAVEPASSSKSAIGNVYGSLFPIFPLKDFVERWTLRFNLLKGKFFPDGPISHAKEEPGLHDNTVQVVYRAEEVPQDAGEVLDSSSEIFVPVQENGFKFTVETDAEKILHHVNVSIASTLKKEGYNRLTLSNKGIFQLRNLSQKTKNLSHFFVELSNEHGELWHLLQANPGLEMTRKLSIKLERVMGKRSTVVTLPIRLEGVSELVPAQALVDNKLLPQDANIAVGEILVKEDGSIYYHQTGKEAVQLSKYYVRLPKGDSKYWAPMMAAKPEVPFSLSLRPTTDKLGVLAGWLSANMLGMGKTISPELEARSSLGETAASSIMFTINNITPVLVRFLRPIMEKRGESTVLRLGSLFFIAGGATALGSHLWGTLGTGAMSTAQLVGFLTSTALIAIGTSVVRFAQNLAILANLGEANVKKKGPEEKPTESYDLKYLAKRMKEVVTVKPEGPAGVTIWYQKAQMFKNIGTLGFLMLPWIINAVTKWTTGADLGLDFSASYIPYTLLAAFTALKLSRMAVKDTVPHDLSTLQSRLNETIAQVTGDLRKHPLEKFNPEDKLLHEKVKEINESLELYLRAKIRQNKKVKINEKEIIRHTQRQSKKALRYALMQEGVSSADAFKAATAMQKTFNSLDYRSQRVLKVLAKPGVWTGAIAVTLATIHELSVSNGFAFAIRRLIEDGAIANGVTALALYGSMILGRLGGNWLNRRISNGSMYAFSSLFSIGGTATMIAALSSGGNLPMLITGAVLASFGVGNFFSQMYDYLTGLYKGKYKRIISLIINYTMPAAAVLSMPMRQLVQVTGIPSVDLIISGVALLASLALTPKMLAESSVVKAVRQAGKSLKNKFKKLFHKRSKKTKLPPTDLDNPAPAQ